MADRSRLGQGYAIGAQPLTPQPTRANRLWIDLDTVARNVSAVRASIGERALVASLKADAYGHGAVEVAATAMACGAIGVAVGDLESAIRLRACMRSGLLLVYAGPTFDQQSLARASRADVAVTVPDLEAIRELDRKAESPLDVFLEIDIGHERLGVPPEAAVLAAREIVASSRLQFLGLLAHAFAASDASDAYVAWQLGRFSAALDDLGAHGLLPEHVIAESTAVLSRGEATPTDPRFTSVDPGRLLVGLGGGAQGPRVVPALVSLTSHIVHIKEARGAPTAEGPPGVRRGMRLGVLPIGRADGLDGVTAGEVLVAGRRVPILAIWTEHSTIDLSTAPGAQVGDSVVLFGGQGGQGGQAVDSHEVLAAHPGMREIDVSLSIRPSVQRCYRVAGAWVEPGDGSIREWYDQLTRSVRLTQRASADDSPGRL